ncbi:copper resistance CopC family protein [Specibacter sp. RAF43]|uniref:copper resistance CopC family protein n=1 Tax=Specibacter sp. RAF43 TaxID=3233057 RepID=UPI003F9B8D22
MTPPGAAAGTRAAAARATGARVLWRALASAAVVLVALTGGSSVALAHDSEVSTSPANGATVATMPEHVTVTMSDTPAAIGAEIKVLDAAGTNWSEGRVGVLDAVATQQVKPGAPAGTYTVQWRLVSSDTHPVEGEFAFTTTASGSGAAAGPVQSLQQTQIPVAEQAPVTGGVPWSIFALIGVLVVVVAALLVVARRRLKLDD